MTEQLCHNFLIEPESTGLRLDSFLASELALLTRSQAARCIEEGRVSLNGQPCTQKSLKLQLGDRLQLHLECALESESRPQRLKPYYIPLDIRYEDDYLLVISKPLGLVCHPAPGHEDDTLANALVAYLGYEHLGMLQGEERPGIVHRLDKDTTGLMLAAKTDEAQKALQDLIRLRELDRRYLTLVHGYVAPDKAKIESGIARSNRDRLKMCVSDSPFARAAITTFKTLERFEAARFDDGYSLLECHLYTGRTHQIRVHLRSINHPLVGDPVYGTGDARKNLGLSRQFLHSYSIRFLHPITGESIDIQERLPQDLLGALSSIQARSMGKTPCGAALASYYEQKESCGI